MLQGLAVRTCRCSQFTCPWRAKAVYTTRGLPSVYCGSAIYAPRISPRYEVVSIAAPPCTLRCLSETGGALNIGPSGDSRVAVPRCQNKEIQSLASTHSHTVFRVSGLGVTFASLHGSRQGELSAFKHIPHFVPLRGTGQTLLRIIIRIYPHIYIYTRIKKNKKKNVHDVLWEAETPG